MDLSMPVIDGYQSTDLIREFIKKKGIFQPMIVACTGHTEEEYINKAWRYQIDEVLPKPASLQVVKTILDEIVVILKK